MLGLGSVAAAFTVMLVAWTSGASMGWVLLAYALVGTGVGLAATPASRSLMSSVPSSRGGMGSAFLDLTRDFGGAIMQAIMGALLAGAYAARIGADLAALPPQDAAKVSDDTADALTSSFQSAEQVAQQYPDYASQITSAAADAFTSGKSAAIAVALLMTLIGLVLVLVVYPRKDAEEAYYAAGGRQGRCDAVTADDLLITTERLDLHTVLPEEYAILQHDRADPRLWVDRGFANPLGHLVDDPGPLPYRIPRVDGRSRTRRPTCSGWRCCASGRS